MTKERLNFQKRFQLHKACATDNVRPVLNYILFRNGYAYATDAHIVVRAKIEDISTFNPEQIEMLEGHLLHRKKYEMLLKYNTVAVEKTMATNEEGKLVETAQFRVYGEDNEDIIIPMHKEGDGYKYPNPEAILNKKVGGGNIPCIGFKIGLLSRLSDAMGGINIVEMHFTDKSTQIEVTSKGELEYQDVRGIIMPVLVD